MNRNLNLSFLDWSQKETNTFKLSLKLIKWTGNPCFDSDYNEKQTKKLGILLFPYENQLIIIS